MSHKKGFTLLEILLVVGIIAILAGIVILAINPARQLALARNTQRKSDLKQIYNAISQYYIENSAYPASSTPSTLTEICDTGATTTPHSIACGSLIDLSILVPTYLTAIPKDPSGASSTLTFIPTAYAAANGTGYKIMTDTTNRLILTAPLAELGTSIAIGTSTVASGGSTLSAGLIAHYLMNDNAGNTTVADTKGNNGVAERNTSLLATSKINEALSFNGINNGIDLGTSSALNPSSIAVSMWASPQVGGQWVLFSRDSSTGRSYSFGFGPGIQINGSGAISCTPYNPSGWHNYIFQGSPSIGWQIYIDGSLVCSAGWSAMNSTPTTHTYIGMRDYSGNSQAWVSAFIDDVRVYNQTLSTSTILSLYNSGLGTESESGVLGTNLVSHYLMNDNTSNPTVVDNVGGNNGIAKQKTDSLDVTINTNLLATSKIGGALSFNGSSDFIQSSDYVGITGNSPRSISCWVKLSSLSSDYAFVGLGQSYDNATFQIEYMNSYSWGWRIMGYNTDYNTGVFATTTNDWYSAVLTYDGIISKLYINGSQVGSDFTNNFDTPDYYLTIGMRENYSNLFNGLLDDVRVYDRALTQSEITQLYNGGAGTEAE